MPRRKIENKVIEVILLQQDKHLGEKYEIVKVKPIFARNVLFPKWIAVPATKFNLNKYEQKMEAAKKHTADKVANLSELFTKIDNDDGITITRKANKEDVLYAQVTGEDISTFIKEKYGIAVDSYYFKIKKKIKTIGNYTITFMYKDLKREIALKVLGEKTKEEKKEEKKVESLKETEEVSKITEKEEK